MSVIVMGMEMPERCETCDLIFDDDSGLEVCCCTGEIVDREEQARPRWCPLRPLPEKHGRLIDADAFIGTIRPIVEEDDYAVCTFRTVKELMTEHIDEAPTIVETEGE